MFAQLCKEIDIEPHADFKFSDISELYEIFIKV